MDINELLCRLGTTALVIGLTSCGAAEDGGVRGTDGPDDQNIESSENGETTSDCGDCPYNSGEGIAANSMTGDGGSGPDGTGGQEGGDPIDVEPGQLTAGRWSDLDNWDFWTKLMTPTDVYRDLVTGWGLRPFEHVPVRIVSSGAPVVDQLVELTDGEAQVLWRARTDVDGEAYLFPAFLADHDVEGLAVSAGSASVVLTPDAEGTIELELGQAAAPQAGLDVLFEIDVTGSMLDEQSYLKAEMRDVMQRLIAERPDLDVRASFNFYCDPDDAFVVQSHPFSDVETALAVLDRGAACGGGDYEEAVDEGLEDALDHEWSDSARARILFLILDAPPHTDDAGKQRLQTFAQQAAERGIKLVPVVSSGANHPLEFLMRSLVIATNGTYTFLTADSGIGGEKLEPTIGQYEVEYLNELMLDLLLTETALPDVAVQL